MTSLQQNPLTIVNMSTCILTFLTSGILITSFSLFKESMCDTSYSRTTSYIEDGYFRRFTFPPGTLLIFEPELTLPVWRNYHVPKEQSKQRKLHDFPICNGEGVNAVSGRESQDEEEEDIAAVKNVALQISSPFYVYFDKLGWTHQDSIFNAPQSVASYIQEYLVNPSLHIFGVSPPVSKGISKKYGSMGSSSSDHSNRRKSMSLSEKHHLQLFLKIESLLEEIGAKNGRACLLRAICELHEFPFDTGRFGIFGEVLALLLSLSTEAGDDVYLNQSLYSDSGASPNQCLNVYMKAEKNGKARKCTSYAKYCEHSIFHWYWKMGKRVT